jgi:hypothetical protein
MAGNVEVVGNDLDPLNDAFDERLAGSAVALVGQLNSHEQFGGSDCADRHVGVGRKHIGRISGATFQRDERSRRRGSVAPRISCLRRADEAAEVLQVVFPFEIRWMLADKRTQIGKRRSVSRRDRGDCATSPYGVNSTPSGLLSTHL